MKGITLTAALLLPTLGYALELPERLRVPNRGGRCAWACLETAANALGDDRLRGLVNLRGGLSWDAYTTSDPGYVETIADQLDKLGVRYHLDPDYTHDYGTLHKYAKTRGVLVGLYKNSQWMWGKRLTTCHAVLVTDIDPDYVYFYCPDNPWKIWRGNRAWFKESWTGSAVVILEADP